MVAVVAVKVVPRGQKCSRSRAQQGVGRSGGETEKGKRGGEVGVDEHVSGRGVSGNERCRGSDNAKYAVASPQNYAAALLSRRGRT